MGQLVEALLWADNNRRTDLSAQVSSFRLFVRR